MVHLCFLIMSVLVFVITPCDICLEDLRVFQIIPEQDEFSCSALGSQLYFMLFQIPMSESHAILVLKM